MDRPTDAGRAAPPAPSPLHRWECPCDPRRPTLLAMYDDAGEIRIKFRDRFFFVHGAVRAICPKCGAEHVMDRRRRVADG